MSWMHELYKTYENNIGRDQEGREKLTPIAHMNANAQVEIVINVKGEFVGAEEVPKECARTLIPVTEASSGRSSGAAPHALCDTLSYIAGDYFDYCENQKKKDDKYVKYMTGLQQWVESPYSHLKIKAIYNYLSKSVLISDLIGAGIIGLNEEGKFDNKKINGQPYEKVLVRFRVLGDDENISDKVWEDVSLIQMYTKYYLSQESGKEDVCYLTGASKSVAINHPKGIVSANYGAKLMSANDTQGYTYRGRFQNAEQAFSLSYEASQKVHSALTWLAKNQGAYAGSQDKRVFICWNPEGKKLPDIMNLFTFGESEEKTDDNIAYRKKLIKVFQGYREEFDEDDNVIIMALDAATTGRLSITYYNELMATDFWNRSQEWGETCYWKYRKYSEQKGVYYEEESPTFQRIVKCAFGRERKNFIDVDDKIQKEQTQRLLKCMLDKQPFPADILQALTIRASTPLAYSTGNRELVLSTACAVIRKYYYDHKIIEKGEKDYMKLDVENRDRSYLFGRLLAVLEKVEKSTYDKGESRETNAIRLQSAYVNHPMQTWKILEDVLKPYFQKLNAGSREYYRRLISGIVELLPDEDESSLNQGLKENYLLGYYLQRAELNQKKETIKEENENE